ncbi:MAG: large conductance mechanosensitive channel protein MscL [Planctomycetes bacterium]|nr:large conductance mechanosensitive channel protein MscL [Planctomycetota bacterium]
MSRRATTLLEEFKAFALKGNVIDLAIGVVIGAAFAKIIDSLVKHLIMPIIGAVLPGEKGYLGWKFTLGGSEVPYGLFIGEVINFLIVGFALFIFLKKFLGWALRQKKQEEQPATPPLTKDQEFLAEIRDLLKTQRGQSVDTKPASALPA